LNDSAGNSFELRLHNNRLYVMKVETSGAILYGGELVLDPLPDSVLYGGSGSTDATAVEGSATLDTTPEDFIANNQSDFEETMSAETGGTAEVDGVDAGSAIVRYSVYFDSSVDTATVDAVAASLDTDAGLQSILAKSSTLTTTTAAKTPGTTTGKITKKVAVPKIVKAGVSDGVLSITAVGAYNAWAYKYSGTTSYTTLDPSVSSVAITPPSADFTVTIRLLSPDNTQLGVPRTLSLSMLPIPLFQLNPKTDDGMTYNATAASDMKDAVSGATFAVGANSNLRWQNGGSHAVYAGVFTATEHAFGPTPWGHGQVNQGSRFDTQMQMEDETTMPAVLAQMETSQEFSISYWFRSTINYKNPTGWYAAIANNTSVKVTGGPVITHFIAVPDSWTQNYSSTKSSWAPGGGWFSGLANANSKVAYMHLYSSQTSAAIFHWSDAVLASSNTDAAVSGDIGNRIVQGGYSLSRTQKHHYLDGQWHQLIQSRKTGAYWKVYIDGVEYKDLDAQTGGFQFPEQSATYAKLSDVPMKMANVGHPVAPAVGGGVSFGMSGYSVDMDINGNNDNLREKANPALMFADFRVSNQSVGASGAQAMYDAKKNDVKTSFIDQPGTSSYWGPWVN